MESKTYYPDTIDGNPLPISGDLVSKAGSNSKLSSSIDSALNGISNNFPQTQYGIATDLISSSLNSQTKKILGNYSFGALGAIQVGTYPAIKISPAGIVGKNSGGTTTFSIDGTTGDATFAGTLAASVVYAGSIQANQIQAGTLNAGVIYSGTINADKINAGTFNVGVIYAGAINASQITAGTLYVGGGGEAAAIYIRQGTISDSAKLRWAGGSRIWEDSSNRLGINSIGSPMYLYVNSTQRMVIPSSGQINVIDGINITSGNLNVSAGDVRFRQNLLIDYDNIGFGDGSEGSGGSKLFTVRDFGITFSNDGSGRRQINMGGYTFKIDATAGSPWFHVNGNAKSAIVPTSRGFNALYCVEAPEVWFMDFCPSKKKISQMFLEVTEGDMHFIKCEKGWQVWRRRKGHANKRFEHKTYWQFLKNEKFLSLAK